jgi:hypothetical protein
LAQACGRFDPEKFRPARKSCGRERAQCLSRGVPVPPVLYISQPRPISSQAQQAPGLVGVSLELGLLNRLSRPFPEVVRSVWHFTSSPQLSKVNACPSRGKFQITRLAQIGGPFFCRYGPANV